jgi:hypothetical protein
MDFFCEGHFDRSGEKIRAQVLIYGTPLCADCFHGRTFNLNPWEDAEIRARMLARIRSQATDPVWRAKISKARKKFLSDPVMRLITGRRMTEKPESRAKITERLKAAWQRPDARARMIEAHRESLAKPEILAAMSARQKKLWQEPMWRLNTIAAAKKAMSHPAVSAKISEAAKNAWNDPEIRARMIAGMRRARAARRSGTVEEHG